MARTLSIWPRRTLSEDLPSVFERFWNEPMVSFPRSALAQEPLDIRMDVYQEDDSLKVHAAVPGMKRDDLHVEVREDELRVWGERKEEREHEEEDVYMRENRYGRVERRITLPRVVDAKKATARFHDGILDLTLPIREDGERREIEIQV